MMRAILLSALVAVTTVGLAVTAVAGDLDTADWALTAPIEMPRGTVRPVAEFTLSPEILGVTRPGFADLRIVSRDSDEVAFQARTSAGSVHKVPTEAKLYNRAFIPDRETSVTLDFGSKFLKNHLQVKTPGTNFRRRVSIEGSDDGEAWQTIREGAFLFRVQRPDRETDSYESNVVSFPDNDLRFLRVTVLNGEDDRGVLPIEGVQAWKQIREPAETTQVAVVSVHTERVKKDSEITLDLGYPNLRLHELELTFADPNFFRRISVWGRNQASTVVRRVVEDSPALERTVPVPWEIITSGAVHRFSGEKEQEESRRISLNGSSFRYLLVRIENGNDPPLGFETAQVTRLVQRVTFAATKEGMYSLYTGNSRVLAPQYDIGHYLGRLRNQGVTEAIVGRLVPNPLHKPSSRQIPWSEQHKELLWLVLVAMAGILGVLVYRMARGAGRQQP
jgi:hypothetical protein